MKIFNQFKSLVILTYFLTVSDNCLSEPWNVTAQVISMEAGDVACYVKLRDHKNNTEQVMANFEICEQRQFIGQSVVVYFETANVLAASCNGNVDCGKSDSVVLITQMVKAQQPMRTQLSTSKPVPSHCFTNERIIFSCNTNSNKVISVCASPNLNPHRGYLQYRFGSSGYFPEYVYPANQDLATQFFYSGLLSYSGGGGAYLKFVNGTHVYVIYTGIGRGWEKEGLVVYESNDEISRYTCKNEWISELGPELFKQTGLVSDPYGFNIPIDYDE